MSIVSSVGFLAVDNAIQKALKRRDELRRELQKIEGFLEVYEELSRTEPEQSVPVSTEISANGALNDDSRQLRRLPGRPRRSARPKEVVAAAVAILREEGHPMTRGEINQALERRGVRVAGDDPSRYVGTIMWRNQDTFESIEGRGYWLKGEPIPDDLIG